jgi:hypothetical protein
MRWSMLRIGLFGLIAMSGGAAVNALMAADATGTKVKLLPHVGTFTTTPAPTTAGTGKVAPLSDVALRSTDPQGWLLKHADGDEAAIQSLSARVAALEGQLAQEQDQIKHLETVAGAHPQNMHRMAITKVNFDRVPGDALMEFWVPN